MIASYFFGYGSLVNHSTHHYTDAHPACLHGWQRTWCHIPLRPIAFLSVQPCEGSKIDGIIAHVPNDDWTALDTREFAYNRIAVNQALHHPKAETIDTAVYSVPQPAAAPSDAPYPILLSYLDVVVQGYLRQFGEAGVAAFFATTTGWDAPVLNDRAAPQYPRHRLLDTAETQLVDHHLDLLKIRPRS